MVATSFHRNWRLRAFSLLAVVGLLVAACGGDSDDTASEAQSGAEAQAEAESQPDVDFRFALNLAWQTWDPHRVVAVAAADPIWLGQVYEKLLVLDRDDAGEVVLRPQLASSFTVADDGLSVELELREGVTFQDGNVFDAEAVRANIERAKGPDSTVASAFANVDSVEVVDDTHVVFELAAPEPAFPYRLAIGSPGFMISPAAFDTDLNEHPVGTGPFTLVEFAPGGDATFERWDDYWDVESVNIRQLTISTVTDGNARYNALRSGDYDAALLTSPHDAEAEALEADEGYHVTTAVGATTGLLVNSSLPPLDDVRVRRAISMAVDRQAIYDQLTKVSPPTAQVFWQGTVGYDSSLEDPYDPDAARELIQEAGADGAKITIVQQQTPPVDAIATVLQQQLGDIGLDVELVPVGGAVEPRQNFRGGTYHGFMAYIINSVDPSETIATSYLGDDNPGKKPEELVQMADAANQLPLDSDERTTAYEEIARYLYDNPIHIPMGESTAIVVSAPQVVGSDRLTPVSLSYLDFRGVGIAAG